MNVLHCVKCKHNVPNSDNTGDYKLSITGHQEIENKLTSTSSDLT